MEILEWIDKKHSDRNKKLSDYKYFEHTVVGGICFLTLIFTLSYALLSRTVYFWDSSTYWDISSMLAKKPINFGFISEVYNSVGTSDYNYLVAVPVALWLKMFGTSRVSYIAAITLFYLIPSELAIYKLSKRISKAPLVAFAITVAIIPSLMYLTAIGFIDVAGVFVALLCYLIYFKDEKNTKDSVILGVLLTLIMVVRRYFAFFSVSFVTVMIIDAILFKKDRKKLFITLLSLALTLVVFLYPFLRNILLKDYGALYAGYKYNPVTDIKLITRYFGLTFLLTLLASVPYAIVKKHEIKGAFALLQMLICVFMFVSTQTHGQQHLLLYVPALAVIVITGINAIQKQWMFIFICVLAAVNMLSPCIWRTQPQNIQEIKSLALFPSYSVKPEKRDDIHELIALRRILDEQIPEGEKCGVLASSFVINSSIIENVIESVNMKEAREDQYITGLPEVDSRDYWRLDELYNINYLLVATPAQTHLAKGQQTIVEQAVSSFKNYTDIARFFERVNGFKARIGNINLELYRRIGDVTETAKTEYRLRLYK